MEGEILGSEKGTLVTLVQLPVNSCKWNMGTNNVVESRLVIARVGWGWEKRVNIIRGYKRAVKRLLSSEDLKYNITTMVNSIILYT